LISRKNEEDLFLSSYFDSDKYMVTEDSLIVVEINEGKGRLAKVGDIMKVYFTFLTVDGDTLLDFQTGRPYELVFGDMALGRGFYEALSLISKGGHIECVIPSSLAFGKDGFYDAILPYTTFKLDLDVVDIMTSDEYEAEQEELMNKKLKEESRNIAKYLKDNNINVEPTSTGLYYIDTEVGSGDSAQIGDMVMVHYTIYNIDNEKIESSYDYNQPMTFIYGNNQMIPGIEEAVGYMKVGGKAKIIVPFQLGFGDIVIDEALPANSTLIVDLEFVGLQR
jgi:FKBP-type peptidyl-prolyl cis-trans isomerase